MILHESSGPLRYIRGQAGSYKLIVEVDRDIVGLYRRLLPRWIRTNPQAYAPHISVIRRETPVYAYRWGKREGQEVPFVYSPVVHAGGVYYWLNAYSLALEEIRLELGLPLIDRFGVEAEGFRKTFHITIGNTKC